MSSLSAVLAIALSSAAPTYVPTGAAITPEAAPGAVFQTLNPGVAELPDYVVGQAANLSISPDGRTLAILTSGFNRNRDAKGKVVLAASTEFVFLYDPETHEVFDNSAFGDNERLLKLGMMKTNKIEFFTYE